MPGVKTNEREGTRAVLRHTRISPNKARQVLDLIRGQDVDRAAETLALGDREAATIIGKVLASAVANAVHNDGLNGEELYVSACFADEGSTLKRWRPRARGRATRIRKRSSHVTIIVSRLPEERLARRRAKLAATGTQRSRRVAGSRRRQRSEAETSRPSSAPEVDELEPDEVLDVVEPDIDEVEDFDTDDEVEDFDTDFDTDDDEVEDFDTDDDEVEDFDTDDEVEDFDTDVDTDTADQADDTDAAEDTVAVDAAEDEGADAQATSSDETSGASAEKKGK